MGHLRSAHEQIILQEDPNNAANQINRIIFMLKVFSTEDAFRLFVLSSTFMHGMRFLLLLLQDLSTRKQISGEKEDRHRASACRPNNTCLDS